MKKLSKIPKLIIFLIFLFSCDWPKTVVTNYIHPDGSVTRRVVMRNNDDEIDPVNYRVPIDSTWTFSETVEIIDKDTTWIITAEKHFISVDDINRDYESDQGANKRLKRNASFKKKFVWFNTIYTYSENICRTLDVELRAEDYFDEKESEWFNKPQSVIDSLLKSPDSLIYKAQETIVDSVEERYLLSALINQWAQNYLKIVPDSEFIELKKELLVESGIVDEDQDSIFLTALGEEYYLKNKVAVDTALSQLDSTFSEAFSSKFYVLETVMPGKLIASNGYETSGGKVIWDVDSKYFLSQDYIMIAISKIVNPWAWVVTGFAIMLIVVLILYWAMKKKTRK
jgi:hypothetical protein